MIELLVVMTIILILGTLGFIAYGYANASGRDSRRKSDIEQLRSALEFYRSDNGFYPDPSSGSSASFVAVDSALHDAIVTGGYMSQLPSDPKDNVANPYKIILTDGRGTPMHYYGYCLAAKLESSAATNSNCSTALTEDYNYGVKNP